MVPTRKEDLRKLVTETTVDVYEELTPQLIQLIEKTHHDDSLTQAQKQDEISLHMLGYVKSCTNEIIVEVLAEILGLDNDKKSCQNEKNNCHDKQGEVHMGLKNRVKEHRARMDVNQSQLGKLAGVSRQTISLIERGDYSPSVALALKLARIFEVPVEEIFELEEDE